MFAGGAEDGEGFGRGGHFWVGRGGCFSLVVGMGKVMRLVVGVTVSAGDGEDEGGIGKLSLSVMAQVYIFSFQDTTVRL